MSCDEDIYPEPEVFRPERFLNLPKPQVDAIDSRNFVFGFGRRFVEIQSYTHTVPRLTLASCSVCPGRWLADDNVFLLTARILSTMNISRVRDKDGKEIIPTLDFTTGLARYVALLLVPIRG